MNKIKETYEQINKFGQLCKNNHLDSHAAAAAFFMFVSIIPIIILVLAIVPFTPLTDEILLSIVNIVLPDRLDAYAVDIMNQLMDQSLTAVSLSIIAVMWTAARSLLTIRHGLDEVNGIKETKNFILDRINAAFYTFILIFSFLGILLLNVVLNGIDRYFNYLVGFSISERYDLLNIILKLRPLITIVIGFLVSLYFFTFLPNLKIKMKTQIPGAVLVGIIWYLYSTLFGVYINNFNAYSMYGSLSVVIIVLIWLYACMYILFLGGQFNNYILLNKNNKS